MNFVAAPRDQDGLHYPIGTPPPDGVLVEVAPGIRWFRVPLPFALDHINLWLVADKTADGQPGWAIIDTGINTPAVRDIWEDIFANHLDGKPVTRVICTHFHPDHMGLASWLIERWNVSLWTTLGEWAFANGLHQDRSEDFTRMQMDFYGKAGFDQAAMEVVRERANPYPSKVAPIPKTFTRLVDGQVFSIGDHEWKVLVGRGHAPEHACLFCPALNVFLSGDQMLPRISPNISVWPQEPDSRPLAFYFESLTWMKSLPADCLVLPSHGLPFKGLHHRVADLENHHDDRLAEALEACAEPKTAVEIIPVLFDRKMDNHQMFFAVGESLAHLHHLWAEGKVKRLLGEDGVYRFQRA